jgi:hypothetical protein
MQLCKYCTGLLLSVLNSCNLVCVYSINVGFGLNFVHYIGSIEFRPKRRFIKSIPDGLQVVEAVDADFEMEDEQAGVGQLLELPGQRNQRLRKKMLTSGCR